MLQVNESPDQGAGAVLWLDDEIKHFVAQKRKLRSRGIEVLEADTTAKAYHIIASSHDITLCIVDLKLKTDQEGIDFIELVHARHPDVGFLVYSQYAGLPSYNVRLEALGEKLGDRLWNLPKGKAPSVNSKEFDEAFTKPVESLAKRRKPGSRAVTPFIRPHPPAIQFELSVSSFLSLSIDERMTLLSDFRSERADIIDGLFRQGYIWVLFLGDDPTPYRKEKDRQNVLSDASIGKLAQQTNRVPYHFFAHVVADDIDDSMACSSNTEAKGYPTLLIEFGKSTFEIHFDTGLYQTHFDYDFCEFVGLTKGVQFPGLGSMSAKTQPGQPQSRAAYGASYFIVNASILKKIDEDAFPIKLSGMAAFNWTRTRFHRECHSDCEYYEARNVPRRTSIPRRNLRMCVFRDGLLGRTLMEDNPQLQILLQHGKSDIDWDGD